MMKPTYLKLLTATAILGAAVLPGTVAFAEETKEYHSNGQIEFVPDENGTDPIDPNDPSDPGEHNPIDPTDPNGEPEPGTDGPLSIDYASSVNFGQNKITNKDMTYYAEPQFFANEEGNIDENSARPNYVQVSDKRGNNAGWSLSVKQEGNFSNPDTLNKELKGAELTFSNSEAVSNMEDVKAPKVNDITLVPGQSVLIMSAEKNAGVGTWADRFGEVEDMEIEGEKVQKNNGISLFVPGKVAKDAVVYKTKLTWSLSDTPGNSK